MDTAELRDLFTDELYDQLLERYNGDESKIQELVDEYGEDALDSGYAVVEFEDTGMFQVLRIEEVGYFEDDCHAIDAAKEDGICFIPEDELPDSMPEDLKHDGWIDTEENREAIEAYCKKREQLMRQANICAATVAQW